jgi:hypothetical protein
MRRRSPPACRPGATLGPSWIEEVPLRLDFNLLFWFIPLLLAPGPVAAQSSAPVRDLVSVLGSQGWRALELARLRVRDPWLRDEPVYQGLWLRESGAPDSAVFDLLPFAAAPRSRDGVALAFDQGTGSRMWSGFTDPDPIRSALLGSAARALLELWRLVPAIDGGPRDLIRPLQCPGMRVRLGSEAAFGFGTEGRDLPAETRAFMVYAGCRRELGGSWRVGAGLRAYQWRTPGKPDWQDVESTVQLARLPPGDGLRLFLDGSWTPHYRRSILHIERPLRLGSHFGLRPFARLAWGNGLPFGLGFWPGGLDGFPGLGSGEARGDREITLALDLQRQIVGKLSVRGLLAAGRTANGGPLLPQEPWLLGARAGLNLDTRLGPIRLEYGRATERHRAFFVRLGRIF